MTEIAGKAGLTMGELWASAPGKVALIDWLSRRFDLAAFRSEGDASAETHDRLFEAVMRRLEVMEPHRAALESIYADEGPLPLLRRISRTSTALLEAAGIDSSGRRGAARSLALGYVWARLLQVWRADQSPLDRTMAETDARLRSLHSRLRRLRAGF